MVNDIPALAMRLFAPIFLRPFFFLFYSSESETPSTVTIASLAV